MFVSRKPESPVPAIGPDPNSLRPHAERCDAARIPQSRERLIALVLGTPLALFALVAIMTLAVLSTTPARAGDAQPIDLALYAEILERHTVESSDVVGTRVDYRSLRSSKDWVSLTQQVRAARPSKLGRDARLAYWINAYNILAIDLVRSNYPVESIRDIGSFFSPVWKASVGTIDGRDRSLGEIEHEILRKMDEPRIHAAIVCASTSCPSLSRTPYRAESIDADLERAMRTFLANREKGLRIDRQKGTVTLSEIFDWFEADFESRGGVLQAIRPSVREADAEWLGGPGRNASIRHFDYDWTLNDVE